MEWTERLGVDGLRPRRTAGHGTTVVVLACAWAIVLVPSVLFDQWFTLDMGGVFIRATNLHDNIAWALSPYGKEGRYFPAYWLYHFGLFALFAKHVAGYYAVQAGLFGVSLALTCCLFWSITRSRGGTQLLGVTACLGGAVAECMYTVGKAEPAAYLLLISSLVLSRRMSEGPIAARLERGAVVAVLIAVAIWFKETSLVMLAFAPAAAAIAVFVEGRPLMEAVRSSRHARYLWMLAWVIAGIALSKSPYFLFAKQGRDSGSYVDYTIDAQLVFDNLSFYAVQQPDVLLFGLASAWMLAIVALRLRSSPHRFTAEQRANLALTSGLLGIGWGYYCGLLVWRWPMGYYMLLPSVVFKFTAICGFVLARREGLLSPRTVRACLASLALGIAHSFLQTIYVATSQVSYSRMYTEAMNRYLDVAPASSRLVFESFPFYAEQVTNTRQLAEIFTGQRRDMTGIGDLVDPSAVTAEIVKLLHLTQAQLEGNETSFPRTGDYLLVMTGNKLGHWFVRGAAPFFSDESILLKQHAYEMMPVAEDKLFLPSAFLNTWTHRLSVDSTYVGYKLYKVTGKRPRLLWRGRYPDGWMGKSASLRLFPDYGKRARVFVSTPAFNSPNRVVVKQDGKVVEDLLLTEGREAAFDIENTSAEEPTRIEFEVERTVVPKKIKLNRDEREIGVLLRVEPQGAPR